MVLVFEVFEKVKSLYNILHALFLQRWCSACFAQEDLLDASDVSVKGPDNLCGVRGFMTSNHSPLHQPALPPSLHLSLTHKMTHSQTPSFFFYLAVIHLLVLYSAGRFPDGHLSADQYHFWAAEPSHPVWPPPFSTSKTQSHTHLTPIHLPYNECITTGSVSHYSLENL